MSSYVSDDCFGLKQAVIHLKVNFDLMYKKLKTLNENNVSLLILKIQKKA